MAKRVTTKAEYNRRTQHIMIANLIMNAIIPLSLQVTEAIEDEMKFAPNAEVNPADLRQLRQYLNMAYEEAAQILKCHSR